MNYWYAPVVDTGPRTPAVPPELLEAVAAPWRSTAELEAVRTKAKQQAQYDLADAAHQRLQSRRQQSAEDTRQVLQQRQGAAQHQLDAAALDTIAAVDAIWAAQLALLREEAEAAVGDLRGRHEDDLRRLRLDQVVQAHDRGIRPQRRSKDLQNLRRSESVLAASNEFKAASKVKAHADQLAAAEASGAHSAWLLRCHGEQERLLGRQRRELEALRKRLASRLRDVEAARDRDLAQLGRKIKAGIARQQQLFSKERQNLEAALGGCLLNVRSTRVGGSLEDSFPTLALMAIPKPASSSPASPMGGIGDGAAGGPATPTHGSRPSSAYLGPSTSSADLARRHWGAAAVDAAAAVRFAPTPPREAWGSGASGSGNSNSSGSTSSNGGQSCTSSMSSGSTGGGFGSHGHGASVPLLRAPARSTPKTPLGSASVTALGAGGASAGGQAPPSTAVGSGTTGAATGSGSTALTEATLRAMDQAMGAQPSAQRGASASLETSSFKSNRPYAGILWSQP